MDQRTLRVFLTIFGQCINVLNYEARYVEGKRFDLIRENLDH